MTAGACCRLMARSVSSPRVPVAIRNDAASRIATVRVAVTITTGDFIRGTSSKGLHHCPIAILVVARCHAKKGDGSGRYLALHRNGHTPAELDREDGEGVDK